MHAHRFTHVIQHVEVLGNCGVDEIAVAFDNRLEETVVNLEVHVVEVQVFVVLEGNSHRIVAAGSHVYFDHVVVTRSAKENLGIDGINAACRLGQEHCGPDAS